MIMSGYKKNCCALKRQLAYGETDRERYVDGETE